MAKTLREQIKHARALGHKVTYRNRSDGGLMVTSIDGVKFSRALGNRTEGNALIRAINGQALTERQVNQLQIIEKYKTQARKGSKFTEKNSPLPNEIKKAVRRVQRIIRKYKGADFGTVTMKKVRIRFAKGGASDVKSYLKGLEYKAKDIASEERIFGLMQALKSLGLDAQAALLNMLIGKITSNQASDLHNLVYAIGIARRNGNKQDEEDLIKELNTFLNSI